MTYLIVGASSGLGRDIAYEFAKNSNDLILISRDIKDLEHLKSDIEIKFNVKVNIFELDFSYQKNITKFISEKQNFVESIDGVLFPLGMMLEEDNIKNSEENLNKLMSANFYCIANFISKLLNIFEKKNKGLIVGFGSISSSVGRQINTGYASAKSALETYFESLIVSNSNNNINIQFYTLGYLDTNLSFDKKLMLPKGSTTKLAKIIYKNLNQNGSKKFFPFWWFFIDYIIKILPFFITKKIIKYF
tara:strand:- start:51 stop:791 length:741 start_codon:yes stop_codon:yes gene_type:complete